MIRKSQPSKHLAIRTIFVDEARKAFAKAVGKRVDELTQQEKNVALVNHMVKQINHE